MKVYSHDTSSLEGEKKEDTEDINQPINLFHRFSNLVLVNPLINIHPNLYTVSILKILIPRFKNSLQNHIVLSE